MECREGGYYTRVRNRLASSKSQVTNERNSSATPLPLFSSPLPLTHSLTHSISFFLRLFLCLHLPFCLDGCGYRRTTSAPPTETKSKGWGQSGAPPPGVPTYTYAPRRTTGTWTRMDAHTRAHMRRSLARSYCIAVEIKSAAALSLVH